MHEHLLQSGVHLFCAAAPELAPGTLLSQGTFGRRILEHPIVEATALRGDALARRFDLGSAAAARFDLDQDRTILTADPLLTFPVLVELTLEVVRLRSYSQRPSRLDCMFFWQDATLAQQWARQRTWLFGLYAVRVVSCDKVFVADMEALEGGEAAKTTAALFEQAHRYWQESAQPRVPEVLLEGAVEVIAAIDVADGQ